MTRIVSTVYNEPRWRERERETMTSKYVNTSSIQFIFFTIIHSLNLNFSFIHI